ncbi:DUF2141 domain-containing protein [Labilibacter sediminis]|nr:DUF2141 domain-containing protein [Labilibacter sediminis]
MRILFLVIIINCFNLSVFSQLGLRIEFNKLHDNKGFIEVDFRDGDEKFIKGITEKVSDKKCTIILDSLKAGNYAFKYFHDVNSNKKLDTNWIGIPKEGFGFSNDAKVMFGPPPFKNTIFKLHADTVIYCEPIYLEF